jgi:hypothetical protein
VELWPLFSHLGKADVDPLPRVLGRNLASALDVDGDSDAQEFDDGAIAHLARGEINVLPKEVVRSTREEGGRASVEKPVASPCQCHVNQSRQRPENIVQKSGI